MGFGTMIRRWRDEKDMSQADLARRLGCTDGYISQIENEKRLPSEEICFGIEKVFNPTQEEYQAFIDSVETLREQKEEVRKSIKRGAVLRALGESEGAIDLDKVLQELKNDPDVANKLPKLLAIVRSYSTRGNFLQMIDMFFDQTQK